MSTPEAIARQKIDASLEEAGWCVQDNKDLNLMAGPGVAIREFPLKAGHGTCDYLLFVDTRPVGVIEAKKQGDTLTGVEIQTSRYSAGLPDWLDPYSRPLAMLYESTGIETQFTNGLDPDPRSRRVFTFHRPETLKRWSAPALVPLPEEVTRAAEGKQVWDQKWTARRRFQNMPRLEMANLWPAQFEAITNLERSLAEGRPRALVQMATGSGKTYTSINAIYRMIKFGGWSGCSFWSTEAIWDGRR